MIESRSGVVGMPVRLAVSFMIVALMVPPVMGMVDNIKDDISARCLSDAADDLAAMVDSIGNMGTGYTIRMEVTVPDDGYLLIGGDEGMVVRICVDGRQVGRSVMDHSVVGVKQAIQGSCLIQFRNTEDGVEVTEL